MAVTDDPHLSMVRPVVPLTPQGCQECLQIGSPWAHLRLSDPRYADATSATTTVTLSGPPASRASFTSC